MTVCTPFMSAMASSAVSSECSGWIRGFLCRSFRSFSAALTSFYRWLRQAGAVALISVVASIVGHKSAEGLVPACAYVGEMGIVSRVAVFDTANYPRNALACDDSVKVGLGQMMLVERVVPVWDSRKQRLGRSLRNIRLWRHDARCQYISPEMNPHFTRGTATGIFDDHPCGNGVVGRNLFSPNSPRPDPRSLSR